MLFKDYLISIGVNPDVYLEMVKYRAKMFGYDDVIELSNMDDFKINMYHSDNFKIIFILYFFRIITYKYQSKFKIKPFKRQ